ncbi:MAG: hypothetical protein AAFR46_13530 [Pseudomonadota bacterium]
MFELAILVLLWLQPPAPAAPTADSPAGELRLLPEPHTEFRFRFWPLQ